jgi:tetratricopeptide (TPR) repeat protein
MSNDLTCNWFRRSLSLADRLFRHVCWCLFVVFAGAAVAPTEAPAQRSGREGIAQRSEREGFEQRSEREGFAQRSEREGIAEQSGGEQTASQQTERSGRGTTEVIQDAASDRDPVGEFDVERLAEPDYAERQRATLEMWRRRANSRQVVQDAARNADPEVAERAEWILKQWRSGAIPGVAEAPFNSPLAQGDDTLGLASVLERGAFDAARVAVEESAGTIEFEQIKQEVARLLTERFPIYVDLAVAGESEADLLRLLDTVATDRSLAAASHDFRIELGLPIQPDSLLPTSASVWPEFERQTALAQFAMLRGDAEAAIEHAKNAGDRELLRLSRMLAGRWQTITKHAFDEARDAATVDERIDYLSWALAGAKRSGDREAVRQAVTLLLESEAPVTNAAKELRWRSLATHSQIDQAIDVLATTDPALAAKIASAASRFDRGFELCGYPLEALDSELADWIDDAFAAQIQLPAGEIAEQIERLYALARLLLYVGDDRHARQIYFEFDSAEIIVGENSMTLRERTLNELSMVNRPDWLVDLAVRPGEKSVTPRVRNITAWALDADYSAFALAVDQMKVVLRQQDFREQFRAACDLFRGRRPESFQEDDFEKLYELFAPRPKVDRVGGRMVQTEVLTMDLSLVDLFAGIGRQDLARRGLEALARSGDLEALIRWAEVEMTQGDARTAEGLWNQAALKAAEVSTSRAIVTPDHGLAYAKTVVGRWKLAERSGHRRLADQYRRRVRLMLASPSLRFRKEFSDYLREEKVYELAAETLRELIVLASFGDEDSPDLFSVAVAYVGSLEKLHESEPERFEALGMKLSDVMRWSDLAVLGILEQTLYHDTTFISVPISIRKTMLRYAIDAKDPGLVKTALAEIELHDPLNIDVAERLLPELRQAGMEDLADRAFNRLMDRGQRHVERFGTDAMTLNNLAWTAAMNGQRLDQALEFSSRAVALEPDSVVYRDTLAEVLFLLGEVEQALSLEKACLLDEPDEWHLHQQIKKYEEALAKAKS